MSNVSEPPNIADVTIKILENIQQDAQAFREQMQVFQAESREFQAEMQAFRVEMQAFRAETEARFTRVETRMDHVAHRVDALTLRVDNGFADVNVRFDRVIDMFGRYHSDHETRLHSLEERPT